MCPEVQAFYDPNSDLTVIYTGATTPLPGGRCVGVPAAPDVGGSAGIDDLGSGLTKVGLPTAGGWSLGVTSHDVVQNGRVTIMRAPKVVPIEVSAIINAGAEVMAGVDGRVATFAAGVGTAGLVAIGRNIGATTGATGFAKILLYNSGPSGLHSA